MNVTFCSHAHIENNDNIKKWLKSILEFLIENQADTFFLGGYGDFDNLAASTLREIKLNHPNIKLIYVTPYLKLRKNISGYDSIIFPPLELVPPRFAIVKRNQWMVENADIIISYILHDWGGASKTISYAKQKKKHIIEYPSLDALVLL